MKAFKARSILQLTFTGFFMLTILLIAAVIAMANQLDMLSNRSEMTVNKAAEAMRTGRTLIEQIMSMERNARQYAILLDADLLKVYATRREAFIRSARRLDSLNIGNEIKSRIATLMLQEQATFDALGKSPSGNVIETAYPQLLDAAYAVSNSVDNWIDGQLIELRQHAVDTHQLLNIQALFLVSTSLLLAALFTSLITRPLRQIESAINKLGGGSYDKPIQIDGPLDLQALGASLDWLRKRLGELENQRTFFMRHVSHELKTPLTAIHEGAALLNDGLVGPLNEQQYEIIRILRKNCQRLQSQIESLLKFNLDTLSILKPMPHPVRLDKVVDNVIASHELSIKSASLRVVPELRKTVIRGDEEQVKVIVDKLFDNAVKYSPHAGSISIQLSQDETHGILDIFDEGPGISQEERAMIFEAFYQGPAPERRHLPGTGMGLAIAKEYVKLNDGTVEVVEAGFGAHFRVRLPIFKR